MKHLFIVNPVAGKGKALVYMEAIKPLLEGKVDYRIEMTKGRGHATELVKAYTSKDDYIVYAVGGDGTINEVVNGMIGTSSALAIVPAGSGNDFIRTIYPKCNYEELLYKLLKGKRESVDLVRMNDKYFLNIASIGIDAEVVYNATAFKKLKYIKGDLAYVMSIFKTLWFYKTSRLKIALDGQETCDTHILLLAIANGKYYGGGIQIAPSAQVDDAKAHIYMVEQLKLRKILGLIPKLFKAKHEGATEVKVYKAQHVHVKSNDVFKLNMDGEIIETTEVEMEVLPEALQIIVPAS
ncbi:MAG: diacylglycerol/lipid kinase family protein [Cellulosilyticaceae bacterium]